MVHFVNTSCFSNWLMYAGPDSFFNHLISNHRTRIIFPAHKGKNIDCQSLLYCSHIDIRWITNPKTSVLSHGRSNTAEGKNQFSLYTTTVFA